MSGNATAGPLAGIRVIDFTNVVAGPYAAMILADQGADVIKIEGPRRRDFARGAGEGASQLNSVFLNNNRNKRSLSVGGRDDGRRPGDPAAAREDGGCLRAELSVRG